MSATSVYINRNNSQNNESLIASINNNQNNQINQNNHINVDQNKITSFHLAVGCVLRLTGLSVIAFTVWLYIKYKNEPCETNIKLYLLFLSVQSCLNIGNGVYNDCCRDRDSNNTDELCVTASLCISEFASFVYGSVVVFQIDPYSHYCPDTIYLFALITQILIYVKYLFVLILITCLCVVSARQS